MTFNRRRPWVVFGLEGLQRLPSLHRSSIGFAERFLNAIFLHQPQLVGAVSADSSGPMPELTSALPADVPVLDSSSEGPDVPDGMVAVFHVLCLLGDDPVTTLWPEWARKSKTGLVTTVHDITSQRQLESPPSGPVHSLRRSRYRLVEEADAVIATSHAAATYLTGALETDPGRIFVVPDGTRHPHQLPRSRGSVRDHRERDSAHGPTFILAFCEKLDAHAARVLIDSFYTSACGISGPISLQIVTESSGSLEEKAAEKLPRPMREGVSIAWAGGAAEANTPELLRTCSGVIVQDLDATLAWAAIEAMEAGAVTVVPDTGVFREIVPQPEARFNPGSVEDTAAAVTKIVNDEYFRRCRVEDAASSARAYAWEHTLTAAGRAYALAAASRPDSARIAAL